MARSKARRPWNLKEVWSILKETATQWQKHEATRLAAALACYTLLSIAPLVVLSVVVAGFLFGDEAARGEIGRQLAAVVGPDAAKAIEGIIANAKAPAAGIVSSVVGIVVLLFGASGVFGELQSALDRVWSVEPKPGRGIWGIIRDRFFSFAMVLGVAFLLLVSLVLSALLSVVGHFFEQWLPGGEAVWQVLNLAFAFGTTTLLFALIYKVIPDAKIAWRDVWVGAVVTALLFTLGKFALALYIGKSTTTSAFGAAGSLVALVIWVYYSSQILFFGAEFTRVWATRHGSRIRPDEDAVAVPEPDERKGGQRPPEAGRSPGKSPDSGTILA